MKTTRLREPIVLTLLLFAPLAHAQSAAQESTSASAPSTANFDAELAAAIDRCIDAKLAEAGVTPAPAADDAAFHRRATLDLLGRIPTRDETERFLADKSPAKRRELVERLSRDAEMPLFWREVLAGWIMGRTAARDERFVAWLGRCLTNEKSWEGIARDVLLAQPQEAGDRPALAFLQQRLPKNQLSPTFSIDVGRAFLGVNLECARCHDHPYVVEWTQANYFGLAMFFARSTVAKDKAGVLIGEKNDGGGLQFTNREGEKHQARLMFLDGTVIDEPGTDADGGAKDDTPDTAVAAPPGGRRAAFVELALSPDSPYFKRGLVNRVWKQLMDRGLVEPVDMMHEDNPPTHPELLRLLAEDFATHGFDLRRLIVAIMGSRAYGRSSAWPQAGELPDEKLYAVGPLKQLEPPQTSLSLVLATGHDAVMRRQIKLPAEAPTVELRQKADVPDGMLRTLGAYFIDREGDVKPTTTQALFLHNNELAGQLFRPQEGNLADQLAGIDDNAELARRAYLAVLSRPPGNEETALIAEYLAARADARREACGELVWSLVNSSEFRFNH